MISPVRPTPIARKLAVLPYSAEAERPVPAGLHQLGAARRARSGRARRPSASSTRRTRSKTRCVITRCPASRSPITPEREQLHGGDEEDGAEDQRLDVAAAVAVEDPVDQERQPGRQRQQEDDGAGGGEGAQRLVAGVDPQDRRAVAAHVGAGRVEQPRLAGLRIGPDRHLVDRDQHLAGLDQALQRVGEVVDDRELQGGLAVVGAEAGGGVGDRGPREPPHDPAAQPLQALFRAGEVLDLADLAVADDHVGLAGQDRRHQLGDVGAAVLVVGVGVDDDVGAELQAGVQPGLEAGGEALVVGQADDVLDPVLAGDLDGAVAGAVVDDQQLDRRRCRRSARGRSAIVAGSVDSSFKQGIWMISFMRRRSGYSAAPSVWLAGPVAAGPSRVADALAAPRGRPPPCATRAMER